MNELPKKFYLLCLYPTLGWFGPYDSKRKAGDRGRKFEPKNKAEWFVLSEDEYVHLRTISPQDVNE